MTKTIYDKAEDMFDEVFKALKEMGFTREEMKEFELLQGTIRFELLYNMKATWEKQKLENGKVTL
ncbi:hypothetical protein LCGC14_1385420 [marine sediment metagenome]|uniref:Uncharacterized protein n=1 Tax=marine sediment metagenome TaxID=412755 RepID=A0A0F9MGZ2_9ZZZZ